MLAFDLPGARAGVLGLALAAVAFLAAGRFRVVVLLATVPFFLADFRFAAAFAGFLLAAFFFAAFFFATGFFFAAGRFLATFFFVAFFLAAFFLATFFPAFFLAFFWAVFRPVFLDTVLRRAAVPRVFLALDFFFLVAAFFAGMGGASKGELRNGRLYIGGAGAEASEAPK